MLAKYRTLPEWLRWVILLPLTLAFTGLLMRIVAWLAGDHYLLIRQAAAIACFVLLIHSLAPRWQNRFALSVLIGRMVIFAVVIISILARGNSMTPPLWAEVRRELLGWIIGWAVFLILLFRVRSHPNKTPNQALQPTAPSGRG